MIPLKNLDIRLLESEEMVAAFQLIKVLRTHVDWLLFMARLARQQERDYELFGAFSSGNLVGLVGMRPVETLARGFHVHVDDLVVAESARGLGIGRALMNFVECEAKDRGMESVFLDSRQEVLGFYQRLGYDTHTATLVRKSVKNT
jgi:GNAT superfamily N-acetyltransferase